MATAYSSPQHSRPITGIGVSLALHVLLLSAWQLARLPAPPGDDGPRHAFSLRLLPAQRPTAVEPAPAQTPATARIPARPPAARQASSVAAPARPAFPLEAGETAEPSSVAETPGAPAPSPSELLGRAKAAAGDVDRALRREHPRRGIEAPVETAQMKLGNGIERAAEMVPNKWYEAPKVQEIRDPGGYDRRRYRIVGANGTYCMTYESNHAPDGIDTMSRGLQQKRTNCPPHEQPLTFQKWNDAPAPAVRAPLRN